MARNYLKRIIREDFRIRRTKMNEVDIVVMIRQGCNVLDRKKLRIELDALWQELIKCCHG